MIKETISLVLSLFILVSCGSTSMISLAPVLPFDLISNKSLPDDFDVQGHRGARAIKPENTLPSFEIALDMGGNYIRSRFTLHS